MDHALCDATFQFEVEPRTSLAARDPRPLWARPAQRMSKANLSEMGGLQAKYLSRYTFLIPWGEGTWVNELVKVGVPP